MKRSFLFVFISLFCFEQLSAQCTWVPEDGISSLEVLETYTLITEDAVNSIGGVNDFYVCSGVNLEVFASGLHDYWLEEGANLDFSGSGHTNIFALNNNDVILANNGTVYVAAGSTVTVMNSNVIVYAECGSTVIIEGGLVDVYYECEDDIINNHVSPMSVDFFPCTEVIMDFNFPDGVVLDLGGFQDLGCTPVFPYTLDASSVPGPYLWSTGETTPTIQVNAPGTYTCEVPSTCSTAIGTAILAATSISLDLGNDIDYCGMPFPITLNPGGGFDSYLWSTGETTSTIVVEAPGNYSVETTSACGTETDEVYVGGVFPEAPELTLEIDDANCSILWPVLLEIPGAYDTYTWSTGENTPTIEVNAEGSYELIVTNLCGSATYTYNISSNITPPQLDWGPDLTFCDSAFPLNLDAGDSWDSYLWDSGETDQVLVITGPGTYGVTVTSPCGDSYDAITISSSGSAPVVDLGGPYNACEADFPITLDGGVQDNYDWSTGESTQTISVATAGIYSLTVTNTCGTTTGSAAVNNIGDNPTLDWGPDVDFCNAQFPINLDAGDNWDSYLWDGGETDQVLVANGPGTYGVTVTTACGTSYDDIVLGSLGDIPTIDLGPDQSHCDADFPITLDAGAGFDTYQWSTGETTQTIILNGPMLISVEVGNACGTATDEIAIGSSGSAPTVDLGPDQSYCNADFPITLDAGAFDFYDWSSGEDTQIIVVSGPGDFDVTVSNVCGTATDAISVTSAGDVPTIDLGPDQSYCDGDFPITLDAGGGYDSYLWSTGETTQIIVLTGPSTVSVEVENTCGTATDEIVVSSLGGEPTLDLGPDQSICNADFPITLDAGVFDSYDWSSGEDTQLIVVNGPGDFDVAVTNACGSVADAISVTSAGDAPTVDLGPDQAYCDADFPITLDAGVADSYLWSSGEVTQLIVVDGPTTVSVEVGNTCGTATDEIVIESLGGNPDLDFGADQMLCQSELPFEIESNVEGDHIWSSGQTTASIAVNQAGTYSLTVTGMCGSATDAIEIIILEDELVLESFTICEEDSLVYETEVFYTAGVYEWEVSNGATTGCDLFYQVEVNTIGNPQLTEAYDLPFGETLEIYGESLVESGNYLFTVDGENGCDQEVEVRVRFEDRPAILIHVPNAFTPNGDGFNDVFEPTFYDLEVSPLRFYEFTVYDRWGHVIHFSNDPLGNGWIGRAILGGEYYSPDDIYNWVLEYEEEFSTQRQRLTGTVTIVR